jgi:hypothetical protein
VHRYVFLVPGDVKGPTGGIMNIVRHATLARSLGADVVLATDSGKDKHGRRVFRHSIPSIRWTDRRRSDVCIIPDLYTNRVASIGGRCIVYMQSPLWLRQDFDHSRNDVWIWTDSPPMLEKCRQLYPGKDIPIVPNIVDNGAFPFIPQSQREDGMIIVFPRKGPEFIDAVFAEYRRRGGRYWKPKVVDGLSFEKMALIFRRAQAFLASADVEGCALPPQESMAAGVVVIGKDANGCNFCMRHQETALVSNTVEATLTQLQAAEDANTRERLAANAFDFIKRFFPSGEPTRFWRQVLAVTSREDVLVENSLG